MPQIDPKHRQKVKPVAQGISASPGAAVGKVVLSAEAAIKEAAKDPKARLMLVRKETSPEDVAGMHLAQGILTSTGGKASHAAVVARGWGKPCVVGCEAIKIDEAAGTITVKGQTIKAGDYLTIDGATGEVWVAEMPTVDPIIPDEYFTLMKWADKVRTLKVRTNADTPKDAAKAREFGAEGIGLCRTEHMFFGEQRIVAMRKMILADDEAGRKAALAELEPFQTRGLRRHLRGDGRPAGDDPAARPALARVPAARREGPGRGRRAARRQPRRRSATASSSCTSSTRCSASAAAACRSSIPRSATCRSARSSRRPSRSRRRGKTVLPEIMIPLVGDRRGADASSRSERSRSSRPR